MNHASLFSGIGGFDLAAEWMGWENIFNCEWDTYCQQILKQHFPNAKQHGDITKTDFNVYRGQIDILTGGFPCQPFSQAGKRKGTEDDRYLWPEMLRAIREIKPTYIVGENVGGLVTWDNGLVLEQVLSDLENEGYEAGAYIIPACAVNASHRRDRVWIIADTSGKRCKRRFRQTKKGWKKSRERFEAFNQNKNWKDLPKPGISRGDDGFSDRIHRTKALGNAIVPQVAYQIFKSIFNQNIK